MPCLAKQTLLVEGQLYHVERERSWPSEFEDSDGWNWAHSLVYVCPRCLKQWAVLHFPEDRDIHVHGVWCQRHRPEREHNLWQADRVYVPGSLFPLYVVDRPLLRVLPTPLLKREFELHLRRMEMEDESRVHE